MTRLNLLLLALLLVGANLGAQTHIGAFIQPPAVNVPPGTANHPTLTFTIYRDASSSSNIFDALLVPFAGTALASSDWSSIDLYYDADDSSTFTAGDVLLDSAITLNAGNAVFSGFSQPISVGTLSGRNYVVVVDVASAATDGRTFRLFFGPSDVSVTGGQTVDAPLGSPNGLTQTIQTPGTAEMDVERIASVSIPVGTASSDDLGGVALTGASFTYTVFNLDTTDTLLLNGAPIVEFTSLFNATVTLTSAPTATITPLTNTTFTIYVDPLASGNFSFLLSMRNNDADEDPYFFPVIGSAGATQLVIAIQPGSGSGGTVLTTQPVIEARDAANFLDTTYTGDILAVIKTGTGTAGAQLLGTVSVTAIAGVATFTTLGIDLAGTGYVLTFSSAGLTTADAVTVDISIGPAAALRMLTQPDGAVENQPFVTQPLLEVVDAGGNRVTSDNTTLVDATINPMSPPGATLTGTTPVQAASGLLTFPDLQLDTPGLDFTLDFLDTGVLLVPVISAGFDVAGIATQLALATQPGRAVATLAFLDQPVIEIQDALGVLIATDNSTQVTVSLASGSGILGGTLTRTASAGVVSFSGLSIDTAGTGFSLLFDDLAVVLSSVTSATFGVAGPATQLFVATQPDGAQPTFLFTQQPVIEIRDANGVLVANDNSTNVLVAIQGATGAILNTTLTVQAVNGVVTYTDLDINLSGEYRLEFTDVTNTPALTPATSDSFVVGTFVPGSGGSKGGGCIVSGGSAALPILLLLVSLAIVRRRRRPCAELETQF